MIPLPRCPLCRFFFCRCLPPIEKSQKIVTTPFKRKQRRGGIKVREFNRWYNSLKIGVPCADCGVKYPPYITQWHYLDPATKIDAVSALKVIRDKAIIMAEVEKCVLLCANCHIERHAGPLHM